ncbi:PolC-type DNA polymerase III [Bacillus sp. 03113]|uniref:3'-5' exonuclease n=1 Tax=Bacillus sp. 03113 TaxID=2578211 RepID=UPI001142D43E|nr:3'-5' exonuclease [Bacillus sp. 03113]
MGNTYVFIDLETTGLDYKTEQITEIGAIKLDDNFDEIDRFHTMVSLEKGRELPEFITKLTGITAQDLEGWPPENICLTELATFIGDSIVVAQNAPFDLSFISRGDIYPESFICTRALARYVEPELSASLKDVCKRRGIDLNGHHRALNDVEATIEVFKEYVKEAPGYVLLNVVLDEPSRPLKFVPRGSKIRHIYHVALTPLEIVEIARALPNGELKERLSGASNRKGAIN